MDLRKLQIHLCTEGQLGHVQHSLTDREGVEGKPLTSDLSLLGCVYTMSQYSIINLVLQLL